VSQTTKPERSVYLRKKVTGTDETQRPFYLLAAFRSYFISDGYLET